MLEWRQMLVTIQRLRVQSPSCYHYTNLLCMAVFSDLPTALPWMRLTHTMRGSQGFDASRARCFRPTAAVAHDGAILCCFHALRSVLRRPIGSHCFLCKKVTAEAYAGSVLLNGLSRPTYTQRIITESIRFVKILLKTRTDDNF